MARIHQTPANTSPKPLPTKGRIACNVPQIKGAEGRIAFNVSEMNGAESPLINMKATKQYMK